MAATKGSKYKKWSKVNGKAPTMAQRRKIIKQELVDACGGGCALCGYDRCIAALEFHHMDPSLKNPRASLPGGICKLSKQERLEEIKKCLLVCANCHREIEAGHRADLVHTQHESRYGVGTVGALAGPGST